MRSNASLQANQTFEIPGCSALLSAERLVDVSPLALRMSSPFNPGYWLAAA